MILDIERWLSNQKLTVETNELFNESIRCYKANAFRAAFVFSYIAFLTSLKNRILVSQAPTNIPIGQWTKLSSDLKKEDVWEDALLTAINNASNQVFLINDDLRNQIIYWKYRRNDCVHFKKNNVNNSTVESFWTFIKIYLPFFVVGGSKDALINKIVDHYDPSKTPPGANPAPLIHEIDSSVNKNDLEHFYNECVSKIETGQELFSFFNKIYELGSVPIVEELTKYLSSTVDSNRKRLMLSFIRSYPIRIMVIKDQPERIRKIWYGMNGFFGNNYLNVYAILLRNQLIPADQLQASLSRVVENNTYFFSIDVEDYYTLSINGFFKTFENRLIQDEIVKNVDWLNDHSFPIQYFIENIDLNEHIVTALNNMFARNYHPYSLKNRLQEVFGRKTELSSKIRQIAVANNISICDRFDTMLTS